MDNKKNQSRQNETNAKTNSNSVEFASDITDSTTTTKSKSNSKSDCHSK